MAFPADHQRRWLEELRALRSRHPAIDRIVETPTARVEGTIQTAIGPRRYRLVFPPDFPIRPPSVWELADDQQKVVDHRGYGHAFADGSVCLFGHTPEDGWQMQYTAALALDQLAKYLEESTRGEFPRVERIPIEIPLIRISIHPRIMKALRQGARWGRWMGMMSVDGRITLITGASGTNSSPLRRSESIQESFDEKWAAALGLALPCAGLWCRLNDEAEQPLPDKSQSGQWLERHFPTAEARKQLAAAPAVLIVQPKSCWFVVLRVPPPLEAAFAELKISQLYSRVIEEDIPQRLFLRVNDRMQAKEKLGLCQVAIVGVGSLGSTIAVALAKAGVGRFLLLDPEPLEPENVVRHVGGIHEIGLPKVEVVGRAILRINPDAEIIPVPRPLSLDPEGWGAETLVHLQNVARNPKGLLVCTTATVEAERIVNALAITEKRPAVFASVLGRAEHGRVFRVLPGKTPCLQCILHAQAIEPIRFPRFEAQETGIPAYRQPGIPGLGMDIDQVAMIAARLALQSLGEFFHDGIGYPAAHADHYIWSTHGDWEAVDGPLQVRVERIPRHRACPVCGDQAAEPLAADEGAELRRLSDPSFVPPRDRDAK